MLKRILVWSGLWVCGVCGWCVERVMAVLWEVLGGFMFWGVCVCDGCVRRGEMWGVF